MTLTNCKGEKGWDDSTGLGQTISIQWSVITARGNKLYRGVRISSGVPDYHNYVLFSIQLSGMHQTMMLYPCPILSASFSSAMHCLLPSSYSPTSWFSSPYKGHGRQYSNTCRHRPRQQMHTSSLWRWDDKTSESVLKDRDTPSRWSAVRQCRANVWESAGLVRVTLELICASLIHSSGSSTLPLWMPNIDYCHLLVWWQ